MNIFYTFSSVSIIDVYMLAGKDLIKTHNIFIEPFVVIQDCENFFLRSFQSLRRNTKLSELAATYFI